MLEQAPGNDDLRRLAAAAALDEVRPGMTIGLGTGRTAEHFVRFLGERVRAGLDVVGVATSERTAALARSVSFPLTTLDARPVLDLAVDGTDEIDAKLRLIKGGGGALLREKIIATAAKRMIVIAEESKLVESLGAFPLPVEIVPFGAGATRLAIERSLANIGLQATITVRHAGDGPLATDNGNIIVDIFFGRIPDPDRLARELDAITGVVEHGLFIGLATAAIIAGDAGVRRLSG
jgi:ribose 5-phosphate isomerase A